jgi:excisionase family DNA binding protein
MVRSLITSGVFMSENHRFNHSPRLCFVTLESLANQLEISPRTLRRWIQSGRLPAPQRLGRTAFWSQDCLRAALHIGRELTQ